MFNQTAIVLLIVSFLSGCSSKSLQENNSLLAIEARNPASQKENLKSLLAPFVESFSRPVKLYHWGYVGNSTSKYVKGQVGMAWQEAEANAAGNGMYTAIDPYTTKKFGPKLIVSDIPEGFRFLKVDEIEASSVFYYGEKGADTVTEAKIIALGHKLPSKRNHDINISKYKEIFQELKIQAIRYPYYAAKGLRQYSFVLIDQAGIKFSAANLEKAVADYNLCLKSQTCAISFGDYSEDKSLLMDK